MAFSFVVELMFTGRNAKVSVGQNDRARKAQFSAAWCESIAALTPMDGTPDQFLCLALHVAPARLLQVPPPIPTTG
jgi:hypothetical protein